MAVKFLKLKLTQHILLFHFTSVAVIDVRSCGVVRTIMDLKDLRQCLLKMVDSRFYLLCGHTVVPQPLF